MAFITGIASLVLPGPFAFGNNTMRKLTLTTTALIAALAASPAYAGFQSPTPEPEVAGGLIALGLLGAGVRFLRGRAKRG